MVLPEGSFVERAMWPQRHVTTIRAGIQGSYTGRRMKGVFAGQKVGMRSDAERRQ